MATAEVKLERLLNLTALLVDAGRPISAEEIRRQVFGYPERADSFRRTFERDKDELRDMGVNLELRPLPGAPGGVGYAIPSAGFHLPDPGLTSEERMALQLALSLVRLNDRARPGRDALAKLGGRELVADRPDPRSSPVAEIDLTPTMTATFGALADRRPLRFTYRGERREVHPYRLDFQRGRWYLTGHDEVRGALRVFRLDRIEDDIEVGEPAAFERPDHVAGVRLDPWRFGDDPPVDALLRVDDDAAPVVREVLGAAAEWEPDADDDESWRVRVEARDYEAFRSAVVSLLDSVEVLAPAVLRRSVVSWLEGLAP